MERKKAQLKRDSGAENTFVAPDREDSARADTAASPNINEVISTGGQPLDHGTREFMESRFGHDFSNVRIHTDTQAAASAKAISAKAYTVGRDLVFGDGRYTPNTTEGKRLIAHELTHVIQQTGGVQRKVEPISAPSVIGNIRNLSQPQIQREEDDTTSTADTTATNDAEKSDASNDGQNAEEQKQQQKDASGSTTIQDPTVGHTQYSAKTLKELSEKLSGEAGSAKYNFNVQPSGAPITKADVTVTQTIEMPKWTEYAKKSPAVQKAWDNFYAALLSHEQGHIMINGDVFANAHTRFIGKTGGEVAVVSEALKKEVDQKQEAYDSKTDHGRKGDPPTVLDLSAELSAEGEDAETEAVSNASEGEVMRMPLESGLSIRSLTKLRLQPKLTISRPSDIFEIEADKVAAEIVRSETNFNTHQAKGLYDRNLSLPSSGLKGPFTNVSPQILASDTGLNGSMFVQRDEANTSVLPPAQSNMPQNAQSYKQISYLGYNLLPDQGVCEQILKEIALTKGLRGADSYVASFGLYVSDLSNGNYDKQDQANLGYKILSLLKNSLADLKTYADKTVIEPFRNSAKDFIKDILGKSRKVIESEREKYGIKSVGDEGNSTSGPYKAENTTQVDEVMQAALTLSSHQKKIEELKSQEISVSGVRTPNGGAYRTEQEEKAHQEIVAKLLEARSEYYTARVELEGKYPILATYAGVGGNPQLRQRNSVALTDFASNQTVAAQMMGEQINEKLKNIEKIEREISTIKVFSLENIRVGTKSRLGIAAGSLEDKIIEDQAKIETDIELIRNIVLSTISIGLGLITAVATAGGSLVVAAAVGGVSAGITGVDAYIQYQDYMLAKAASGTDFDKAKAISQEDPSFIWVAAAIVAAGFDVAGAARLFKSVVAWIKVARSEQAAGKVISDSVKTGLKQATADAKISQTGEKVLAELEQTEGANVAKTTDATTKAEGQAARTESQPTDSQSQTTTGKPQTSIDAVVEDARRQKLIKLVGGEDKLNDLLKLINGNAEKLEQLLGIAGMTPQRLKKLVDQVSGEISKLDELLKLTRNDLNKLEDLLRYLPETKLKNLITELGSDKVEAYLVKYGAEPLAHYEVDWWKNLIGFTQETKKHVLQSGISKKGVVKGGHEEASFLSDIGKRGIIEKVEDGRIARSYTYRLYKENLGKLTSELHGPEVKTVIKDLNENYDLWEALAEEALDDAIRKLHVPEKGYSEFMGAAQQIDDMSIAIRFQWRDGRVQSFYPYIALTYL